MRTRNIILLIVLLVIIDQAAKLIIYHSFMDINCEIIPQLLDFKPTFNSKYSFVNDSIYKKTGMDAGLTFHIILFPLIWFVLFLFFFYFFSLVFLKELLRTIKCLIFLFVFLQQGIYVDTWVY